MSESADTSRRSSVDDLIASALAYHTPQHLKDLVEFMKRLKKYSIYNSLLLHVQNPSVRMVATAKDWWGRYHRTIRKDTRPMLILAPMHPVLFVFDIRDTEGPDLPASVERELKDPFQAEGDISEGAWSQTCENCTELSITIEFRDLDLLHAGQIGRTGEDSFRMLLNSRHTRTQQYATLVHELAHLFLGHLGESSKGWWKSRQGKDKATVEFEAEIAAHLVCERLGIKTGSDKYLSLYSDGSKMPPYSLGETLKVASKIEEMRHGKMRIKKPKATETKLLPEEEALNEPIIDLDQALRDFAADLE
jgi:hypothetical protein